MNLFETFMAVVRDRAAAGAAPQVRTDHQAPGALAPKQQEPSVDPQHAPVDHAKSELTGEAIRLMVHLNDRVCVQQLADRFPRVLNRVAALWHTPRLAEPYLGELIHSSRESRAGFPLSVLSEINLLRDYYITKVHPRRVDPWDAALYR